MIDGLRIDLCADLRGVGLQQRGVGANGDTLGNSADLHGHVHARSLVQVEVQSLLNERFESWRFHAHFVIARRNARERIDAFAVGFR
jgi:hypothetical protein